MTGMPQAGLLQAGTPQAGALQAGFEQQDFLQANKRSNRPNLGKLSFKPQEGLANPQDGRAGAQQLGAAGALQLGLEVQQDFFRLKLPNKGLRMTGPQHEGLAGAQQDGFAGAQHVGLAGAQQEALAPQEGFSLPSKGPIPRPQEGRDGAQQLGFAGAQQLALGAPQAGLAQQEGLESQQPLPTPNIRSSNSKPKLCVLTQAPSTKDPSKTFHFIEPCLLYTMELTKPNWRRFHSHHYERIRG